MARVARIAGSLLLVRGERYTLIGYPKEPCDWEAHGLDAPPPIERWERPVIELAARAHVALGPVFLTLRSDDATLSDTLAERLLVQRNGSVSERLWRLIVGADDEGNVRPGEYDASWLVEMPLNLWNLVRDTVLRCS